MKEKNTDIFTEEGSATRKALDKESLVSKYEKGPSQYLEGLRGAPWSREDSLKFKCREVDVDFHKLIESIGRGQSDEEIAQELLTEKKIISNLRKHFMSKGLASIEGQD